MAEENIEPPLAPEKNEFDGESMGKSWVGNSDFPSNGSITDPLLSPENNALDGGSMGKDSAGISDFLSNGGGTDPLLNPENNEFDGGSMSKDCVADLDFLTFVSSPNRGRASIDSYHIGDSSRRNSTGIQKVVPRYLRASMGSCHDFCKYGRRHEFEEKPWKALRRKNAKPLLNEPNSLHLLDSGEPKKEQAAMQNSLTDINKHSLDLKPSPDTKYCQRKLTKSKQISSTDGDKHSLDLKPSPGTKYYAPKPKTSKLKSSADSNNHYPVPKLSPDSKHHSPKHRKAKNRSSTYSNYLSSDLKPSPDTKVHSPRPNASKQKSSIDTNGHSLDLKPSPDTKYPSPKPNSSKQESPTDTNNHSPVLKISPDTRVHSPRPKSLKQKSSADNNNHSLVLKPSPDTRVHSPKPKTSLDAKTRLPRKNALSGNNTHLRQYKPLPTKRNPSLNPPEIIKREIPLPSETVEVPAESFSSTRSRTPRTEKTTDHQSKKSSSPKSKTVEVIPSSSGNSNGMRGKGKINRDVKTGREVLASRSSVKKASSTSGATSSSKLVLGKTVPSRARNPGNLKFLPLKDRNRIRRATTKTSNNEKISEKTLHVIKLETEKDVEESVSSDRAVSPLPSPSLPNSLTHVISSSPLSNKNDDEESKYSGSEEEFVTDKESAEIGEVQPVKEKSNKIHRKSRVVGSEDKYRSPVKLKFRSGKVVDLNPDNTTPRRLRFRRARAQGIEDGKGDMRKRTYKKAGDNADASGADMSSVKVVLKHQDLQGKKDAQGLFNNVIEETASKLVESRKSKVKALVGAFETVISLQESKPS